MIQLAHLATGAFAGAACSNPLTATLAGVVMHGLMDVTPHGEINDKDWEMVSAITGIVALAFAVGPGSPILWGAIGGVLPDTEHVIPRKYGGKRDLYPTHRIGVLHSSDTALGIPAWAQVVIGGAVIGSYVGKRFFSRRAN